MDYLNDTTESRKNKHLNFNERMLIEIRLKDGYSNYKIAKELKRPINTITNEIKRGTTTQIKSGIKISVYFAETGNKRYKNNRLNSGTKFKFLACEEFIKHAENKMKNDSWSPDACVGEAILNQRFEPSKMVCTKTLYNYIDADLLSIKNIDLPMKLRRTTKPKKVRENKKNLGTSIEERPLSIETRQEFGHWEIDSVVGKRSGSGSVLMTLVERQTRYAIVVKTPGKTANSVSEAIEELKKIYGAQFSQIFKTITSDNGSEFSKLSELEQETATKVYFTHPYSSYERGTNERHNGLIRRFIPKGQSIDDYTDDSIFAVEEWMNTLPRKILGYKTPDFLYEEELNKIYTVKKVS